MAKSSSKKLPNFRSVDNLVEFFDAHDVGDHLGCLPEVHFDIDIRRRTHLFALDVELADRVSEIARAKDMPSEVLINSWLREKLLEHA